MNDLPKTYMGYKVEKLLHTLHEIQNGGTKSSQSKIKAMSKLVREYKLTPVHQKNKKRDAKKIEG